MEKSPQELSEEQFAQLEQMRKDYLATFSTNAGKRVLKNLEDTCFYRRSTFSKGEGKTYLNEGMRFVVVHIKNTMFMDIGKLKELTEKE